LIIGFSFLKPFFGSGVLQTRGEREFPFPTIPGNTGLPFPFPKFGNDFFIPVPVPKSWECNFLFPFPFPKFGNVIFHSRSHYREWIIMSGIEWEWSSKFYIAMDALRIYIIINEN